MLRLNFFIFCGKEKNGKRETETETETETKTETETERQVTESLLPLSLCLESMYLEDSIEPLR